MAKPKDGDPISVDAGTYGYRSLPVCQLAHGEWVSIPVHVIAGRSEGPRLVVISTQHGDEIGPISVIAHLVRDIDPAHLQGSLVMIPVANPVAFEMGQRATWFDALYNASTGNLNRIWPGKADGFLSEQIAFTITRHVLEDADCVIDMHGSTSGSISIYYAFAIPDDSDLGRWTRQLNVAFGMEIMIRWPEYPGKTLHDFVYHDLGKPSVPVELGAFYGLYPDRPERYPDQPARSVPEVGVTGVMNVMKAMGLLAGEPQLPKRQVIVSPERRCLPMTGGILYPEVGVRDVGLDLPRGHVLGRVVNAMSFEAQEEIRAPYEQNLLLSARDHSPVSKVNPGDQSFHVADLATAEWIVN